MPAGFVRVRAAFVAAIQHTLPIADRVTRVIIHPPRKVMSFYQQSSSRAAHAAREDFSRAAAENC